MTAKIVNSKAPSIDFKVDTTTGVAYISQRKAAELCGVSQSTLSRHVQKYSHHFNLNENNQLDDKTLVLCITDYAQKGNAQAIRSACSLMQAGARAFIYTQVGYNPLQPQPKNKLHEPCVPVRWLCQQLGRSRTSVDRTLNVSIHRMQAFGLSTEVAYVNAERCVSPALIVCSMFTGKDMQRIRAWLLNLAETDTLPTADTLLQLTHP